MKRIFSLLLALCLILSTTAALGEGLWLGGQLGAAAISLSNLSSQKGDQPFEDGVYYGEKYREYGAVPSMLNFGSARLSPGESLYDAKTTTIKKVKASDVVKNLGKLTYYCYAKWQYAEAITDHTIDAMLVMTTPSGVYYATYQTSELYDMRRKTICSWFFDVTELLERALEDNGGELERGEYSFSMFFNDAAFRVTKVRFN